MKEFYCLLFLEPFTLCENHALFLLRYTNIKIPLHNSYWYTRFFIPTFCVPGFVSFLWQAKIISPDTNYMVYIAICHNTALLNESRFSIRVFPFALGYALYQKGRVYGGSSQGKVRNEVIGIVKVTLTKSFDSTTPIDVWYEIRKEWRGQKPKIGEEVVNLQMRHVDRVLRSRFSLAFVKPVFRIHSFSGDEECWLAPPITVFAL